MLLAAGGRFALTLVVRQTMGLLPGPLDAATGPGLAQISLACAFGELFWGVAQALAGPAVLMAPGFLSAAFLARAWPPTWLA